MVDILNLITAVMWLCCIVIWSKIIHDNNKRYKQFRERVEKFEQKIDEIEGVKEKRNNIYRNGNDQDIIR